MVLVFFRDRDRVAVTRHKWAPSRVFFEMYCPDRSSRAKSRIAAGPQSANRVNFCDCLLKLQVRVFVFEFFETAATQVAAPLIPRPCVRLGFRPKPAGAGPTVYIRPTRRLQGTCHHSFCSPVFSKLSRLDVHLSLGTGISRPTGKAPPPPLTQIPPGKEAIKGISKEILQDS
jgi:hypothetical protein